MKVVVAAYSVPEFVPPVQTQQYMKSIPRKSIRGCPLAASFATGLVSFDFPLGAASVTAPRAEPNEHRGRRSLGAA
jgi:hypothetical protein